MISRRQFMKLSAVAGVGLAVPWRLGVQRAWAMQSPQVPLAGSALPQFVEALPDLDIIPAGEGTLELHMKEFKTMVLPANAIPGYTGTWGWGYLQPGQNERASYLGPVVVATRGQPTEVKWVNDLGWSDPARSDVTKVDAYLYSTDQTLHWADPLNFEANHWNHMSMPPAHGSEGAENYHGPIPGVVHLHGGEVPPQIDGGPDAWFTSDGTYKGHGFYSRDGAAATNYAIYRYPNSQESAPAWFHDHTLGVTRLNVYAGLAGGWLITDPAHDPPNLPPLVPLVIQDRRFDANGQLFFPADMAGGILWALNPEHPYWVPEFEGDVIVVNGKAWPFKAVEPRRYTFLFLNGSNARTYEMALTDPVSGNAGPPLWVIGTDGGYLDLPVKIDPLAAANNKLVMMPGERYTVIIDFAGYGPGVVGPNGQAYSGTWLLKNTAKTPFPAGVPAQGTTTGRILQFVVGAPAGPDTSYNPASLAPLRTPMVRLANPATGMPAPGVTIHKTRQLTLNEAMGMGGPALDPVTNQPVVYPGGPLEILVNNTKWSGHRITGVDADGMYMMEPIPGFTDDGYGNFVSEWPQEGETELWEIVNLTADAHPIHLHLVQFQLMNRQAFNLSNYTKAYNAAFPGGGYDPMTGQPYPAGAYMPAFGPPLAYSGGNPRALGGNPDVRAVNRKLRPIYMQGPVLRPLPQEAGWKDTVIVYPGQVTSILVRWAPTDLPADTPPAQAQFPFNPNDGHGYVWHCHIIDHEDNEMMRPDNVTPIPGADRTFVKGSDF